MITIYLEELKEIMSCGCGQPGCEKKAEYIHPRCHLHGGVLAVINKERTDLYCFKCYKAIVSVFHNKITFEKDITPNTKYIDPINMSPIKCTIPDCQNNTGYNIQFKDDKLIIYCNTCREFIVYIFVAEKEFGGK